MSIKRALQAVDGSWEIWPFFECQLWRSFLQQLIDKIKMKTLIKRRIKQTTRCQVIWFGVGRSCKMFARLSREDENIKLTPELSFLLFSFVLISNNKWPSTIPPFFLMSMFLRLNHIIFIATHKKILLSPRVSSIFYRGSLRGLLDLCPVFVSIISSICRSRVLFDYYLCNTNHRKWVWG